MALFSTWYSGGGPVPWEGQGLGQLRRGGVPLPFHFAFPVFPSLFLPAAALPCEGCEGTSAGLFPHSFKQPAPPWHRGPSGRGKLGARRNPCPLCGPTGVSAVNQGSRVVPGLGEGQGCVSALLSPGDDISFFTITRTLYYIIYIYIYIIHTDFFFSPQS